MAKKMEVNNGVVRFGNLLAILIGVLTIFYCLSIDPTMLAFTGPFLVDVGNALLWSFLVLSGLNKAAIVLGRYFTLLALGAFISLGICLLFIPLIGLFVNLAPKDPLVPSAISYFMVMILIWIAADGVSFGYMYQKELDKKE